MEDRSHQGTPRWRVLKCPVRYRSRARRQEQQSAGADPEFAARRLRGVVKAGAPYVPERGDGVWIQMNLQAGHEQGKGGDSFARLRITRTLCRTRPQPRQIDFASGKRGDSLYARLDESDPLEVVEVVSHDRVAVLPRCRREQAVVVEARPHAPRADLSRLHELRNDSARA